MKPLSGTSKELAVQLFRDPMIQNVLKSTLANVVTAPEVKGALIETVESAFSSERSVNTLVELLKKGSNH